MEVYVVLENENPKWVFSTLQGALDFTRGLTLEPSAQGSWTVIPATLDSTDSFHNSKTRYGFKIPEKKS